MKPSSFCYLGNDRFEVVLVEPTAVDVLSLVEGDTRVRVTRFGATGCAKHGWATEDGLPPLRHVAELVAFLGDDDRRGVIELAVELDDVGTLEFDNGACRLTVHATRRFVSVLGSLVLPRHANQLVHELLESPGVSMCFDDSGRIVERPRAL